MCPRLAGRRSTADFVLLGASSRIGMPAELVVKYQDQTLLIATFVQQQNPAARPLWAAVAPLQRQVVPQVLERGLRADHRAG